MSTRSNDDNSSLTLMSPLISTRAPSDDTSIAIAGDSRVLADDGGAGAGVAVTDDVADDDDDAAAEKVGVGVVLFVVTTLSRKSTEITSK